MLSPVAHRLYDRLELWFNPLEVSPANKHTEQQNQYKQNASQNHIVSHEIEIAKCYGNVLKTLGKVKLDNRVNSKWLAIHRSMCLISQRNTSFRNEAFKLKEEQPDEDEYA